MASFSKDAFRTPFGRNVFLRSTRDIKTVSRTFAASTLPSVTIDGFSGQKVLQPGTVLALITSGPETGKVGPFQGVGTDEVHTLTEGTNVTAGTFILTVLGNATTAIAWDANAATVQAAVRAAIAASTDAEDAQFASSVTVTGGPITSAPFVITFNGVSGVDVPVTVVDATSLTGTITVATSTPGAVGATDGRGDLANIVGINNTFLPTQLTERDVEVAVIYEASVVQANCLEMTAAGAFIALTNTTAAQMFGKKSLDIKFH